MVPDRFFSVGRRAAKYFRYGELEASPACPATRHSWGRTRPLRGTVEGKNDAPLARSKISQLAFSRFAPPGAAPPRPPHSMLKTRIVGFGWCDILSFGGPPLSFSTLNVGGRGGWVGNKKSITSSRMHPFQVVRHSFHQPTVLFHQPTELFP